MPRIRTPPPVSLRDAFARGEAALPPLFRTLQMVPESVDATARTFRAIATTSTAEILRVPFFDEPYLEQFSHEADAVRLARFQSGRANILSNHGLFGPVHGSNSTILGVIDGADVVNLDGGAKGIEVSGRISKRADLDQFWGDVADGITTNLSIGYRVWLARDITERGDAVRRILNIDWEPKELSFVTVPAIADARVLSDELLDPDDSASSQRFSGLDSEAATRIASTYEPNTCAFERARDASTGRTDPQRPDREPMPRRESRSTSARQEGATPAGAVSEEADSPPNRVGSTTSADPGDRGRSSPPEPGPEGVDGAGERRGGGAGGGDNNAPQSLDVAQAIAAERRRVSEIRNLCRSLGVDDELRDEFVDGGLQMAQVRERIIDDWAQRGERMPGQSGVASIGYTPEGDISRAMVEALSHRHQLLAADHQLSDHARSLRGASLMRLAERFLAARGVRIASHSPGEIATAAMAATSDFPNVLADVANNALQQAYTGAPRTFLGFSRRVDAPDFRLQLRSQIGDISAIQEVPEGGEYGYAVPSDAGESYQVVKRGVIVPLTFEALVNDDQDAFSRIPRIFGMAAANKESDVVYALVTGNVTMSDGNALYSAAHSNLAGAAALDQAALNGLVALLRKQTAPNGQKLSLMARTLVVPTDLWLTAKQIVTSTTPNSASDVNVFAGMIEPVSEPRLDDDSLTSYYLFADPAMIDIVEWAYLVGEEGVSTETRVGFNVDGMEFKLRHIFGAQFNDWRGTAKNPGM